MNSPDLCARQFRSVIFDFDYTLADSSPGAIDCVNHALERMGFPPCSAQAVRQTIGLSLAATYERVTGSKDGSRFDEFRRLFVERADQVMLQGIAPFESVKPVVEALLKEGMSLAIVSTKFRYRIEQVLEREGLRYGFAVIIGGEDVTTHKPDPTGLNLAISKLGSAPGDVLYVGDSTIDAETAARAAVSFVAVLSGVTPREAFDPHTPLAIIEDLGLLPQVLGQGHSASAIARGESVD